MSRPYLNYKHSGVDWIGEIPEQWSVLRAKYIYREIDDRSVDGSETLLSVSEYYGVAPRANIIDDGDWLTRADSLVDYKKCKVDDLVMNVMLAWKRGLGVASQNGIVSPAYAVFRLTQGGGIAKYFHYLLRTDLFTAEFHRHSTGIIDSRLRLYPDSFFDIRIIVPPIADQRAIVAYLDNKTRKIDALIEKKRRIIDLLKEQRTAIINQAVTKGINPSAKLKDSGIEWIGEIPEHWVVKRVKHMSRVISKGTTPSTIGRETISCGPVRFIKAENIVDGQIVVQPEFFIDEETDRFMERSQLEESDILFVIAGATIGKVGVLEKSMLPANTNQAVCFVRLENSYNHAFIWYWLQSSTIRELTLLNAVQSAQPNLSMESLGNFCLAIPPLAEQNQIVRTLDAVCDKMNHAVKSLERESLLLQEYRIALISEVVTGKMDVRGFARMEAE